MKTRQGIASRYANLLLRPTPVTRSAIKRTVAYHGNAARQRLSAGRQRPASPARTGIPIRSARRLVTQHPDAPPGAPRPRSRSFVVAARSEVDKVRASASCGQKPTVDPHDRMPNTQVRVIETPIRLSDYALQVASTQRLVCWCRLCIRGNLAAYYLFGRFHHLLQRTEPCQTTLLPS